MADAKVGNQGQIQTRQQGPAIKGPAVKQSRASDLDKVYSNLAMGPTSKSDLAKVASGQVVVTAGEPIEDGTAVAKSLVSFMGKFAKQRGEDPKDVEFDFSSENLVKSLFERLSPNAGDNVGSVDSAAAINEALGSISAGGDVTPEKKQQLYEELKRLEGHTASLQNQARQDEQGAMATRMSSSMTTALQGKESTVEAAAKGLNLDPQQSAEDPFMKNLAGYIAMTNGGVAASGDNIRRALFNAMQVAKNTSMDPAQSNLSMTQVAGNMFGRGAAPAPGAPGGKPVDPDKVRF